MTRDQAVHLPSRHAAGKRLAAGTRVGRYVIGEVLGSGGMGTVYVAHDPELDRDVAIKVLHQRTHEARLLREGKAMARVQHPNIVPVFDVGLHEGSVFLALELVDGVTLRLWLREATRSWGEILGVFLDAARGLAAAHAAGFVHRDFKPDNLLVGRDGRARVADFGLATDARGSGWPEESASDAGDGLLDGAPVDAGAELPLAVDGERLTRTDAVIGTPAYMAPEQRRGRTTDPRADQYSFCFVLWEALTGERPGEDVTAPALAALTAARSTARAMPQIPAWLEQVVRRGLAQEPGDRHATMDALIASVEVGLRREGQREGVVAGRYERIRGEVGRLPVAGQRAIDRLTGRMVTLVELPERATEPAVAEMPISPTVLRHRQVVRMLGWTFANARPLAVLDLPESATPLRSAARGQPRALRLAWLADLLRALTYLHRRGVVRALAAEDHALVVDGQLRLLVLDAARGEQARLPGASDLRAVGSLALAMFSDGGAGRGDRASTGSSSGEEEATGADGSPALALPLRVGTPEPLPAGALATLPATVASVVAGLARAGEPGGFTSAAQALGALRTAAAGTLPDETPDARESLLQAGPLAGRDDERRRLYEALRAASAGRGGGILVGGESGAGKSRLVEEVASGGLHFGAQVLRGQESSEGGAPFGLFRDVVRALALAAPASDGEASFLLPVAPDLPALLSLPIRPAPEVDGPSQRARIAETIAHLLERQARPTILILEDVHWAGSESLAVLQALTVAARRLPLLVLGTFRSDERPDLPGLLPALVSIELGRLSRPALAEAVGAMLGEAGHREALVDLLERETEGNPFFLVEAVRALADDAGSTERVATAPLPARVLPGGVLEVVRRRLDRLPSTARRALRLAAVAGRQVDPRLIQTVYLEAPPETWVGPAREAAVLESFDGGLRFTHDKLREGLLQELAEDERRALHRRVADALEGMKSDDAATLAHHCGAAGLDEREARHALTAGIRAIAGGALREGIRLLGRVLELAGQVGLSLDRRVELHRRLGEANFFLGKFAEAERHNLAALEIVGVTLPRARGAWTWLTVRLLIGYGLRRLGGHLREQAEPDERGRALCEAALASARRAAIGAFKLEGIEVLALSLLATTLSERAGRTSAFGLSMLGFSAGLAGFVGWARRLFARARDAGERWQEQAGLAQLGVVEPALVACHGRWSEASEMLGRNLEQALGAGDRLQAGSCQMQIATLRYFTGDFAGMASAFHAGLALWQGYSDEHRHLAVAGEALARALLGARAEARADVVGGLPKVEAAYLMPRLGYQTAGLLADLWDGDLPSALASAHEMADLVEGGAQVHPICAFWVEAPLLAFLAHWEQAGRGPAAARVEARRSEQRARRLIGRLAGWRRFFPFVAPLAAYYEGEACRLAGRPARARRAFTQAVDGAARLGMRWYEALARLALGADAAAEPALRRSHLLLARALFEQQGTPVQLAACEAALAVLEAKAAG